MACKWTGVTTAWVYRKGVDEEGHCETTLIPCANDPVEGEEYCKVHIDARKPWVKT